MLNAEIYEAKCDELLQVHQILYCQLIIKLIYAQFICIGKLPEDNITNYFCKVKIITNLASHYLKDPIEKDKFKNTGCPRIPYPLCF